MSSAAVVGAGTMGNGIAHVLAQHGWTVSLIDTAPDALERATATIRGNLDRQVKKSTIAADAPAQILERIRTGSALDAADGATLVIEAASENPAV
jgi:3-hydroxybutyryl-CoA dehydrogenase